MPTSAPPLVWLRAFESAARLGSFKAAAAELNVSPSTVSHQIRDLEEMLGLPLFERQQRSTVLTDEGRLFYQPLGEGFTLVNSATDQLMTEQKNSLTIGAFPLMMSEILTPNLAEIKQVTEIPHIRFRTNTSTTSLLSASVSDRSDVVIRYGRNVPKPFRGFEAKKLFDVSLVPIQSTMNEEINSLDAFVDQPRIKVSGPFDGWKSWADAWGVTFQGGTYALETDSFLAAIRAVEQGIGVSLGIFPYLNPLIPRGGIRVLDSFRCSTKESAYLVYPPHHKSNLAIEKLSAWLSNYLK